LPPAPSNSLSFMKSMRAIVIALALVGGFYFYTTHHNPAAPSILNDLGNPGKVETVEAVGPPSFDAEEENNISVYRKVLPSVVNITSRTVEFDFFYGEVPQQGQGSGFVIDKQGHILTNYHVVQGAQQVEVTFADRKKYKAQDRGHRSFARSGDHPDQGSEHHSGGAGRFEIARGGTKSFCHRQTHSVSAEP